MSFLLLKLMTQYSPPVLKRMVQLTIYSPFIMNTPSESSSLIESSPRCKRLRFCSYQVQYRLPKITEKGAILVIVCNVLILSAGFAQLQSNYLVKSTFSIAIPLVSMIAFPLAAVVADTCVGRFKVIQASVAHLITSSLLNVLLALLQDYLTSTTVTVCAVNLKAMLYRGHLLCCLCPSFQWTPADRSFWRAAQLC